MRQEWEKKLSLERNNSAENLCFDPRENSGLKMPCVLFGSGKRFLLVGGYWEGNMALFSLESLSLIKVYCQHFDTVSCLSIDFLKEDTLVAGSRNGEVSRWGLDEKEPFLVHKETLWDHTGMVTDIAVSHELRVFATASLDGTAFVYNIYTGKLMKQLTHPELLGFSHVSLCCSPLAVIVLFVKNTKEFLVYSINGQLLAAKNVEFGQILSRIIQKDQNFNDILVAF